MPHQDIASNPYSSKRNFLSYVIGYAALSMVSVYGLYFYAFHAPLSNNPSSWGEFGDFIGGTLSPILTFVSIIALVHTIELQRQQLQIARKELKNSKIELKLTRQELEKSAKAQALTATVLQKQAEYALVTTRLSVLRMELDMYQGYPGETMSMPDQEPALKRQEVIDEIMSSINGFYCEHKSISPEQALVEDAFSE